ncbi:sugar diacid recognition family protein [Bacillus clarus]|nr:sugar diacid recognition family protein [Bacillus clarus]
MNIQGTIIASTDAERIDQFHEGALRCAKQKKTVIITRDDEQRLQGVKAGMNLPLLFHDEGIGVIGITREPENISQYGKILRKMTELLIHENYSLEQLELEQHSYEAFVFDWLQSKDWSASFLDRAKTLGIDLYKEKQLILFSIDQNDAMLQQKIWQHIRNILTKDDLFVRWGNDRFILFMKMNSKKQTFQFLNRLKQDCETLFSITLYINIGQTVMPSNMNVSYEQALRALSVSLETKGIVFNEDLRLEMCLQDISTETRKEFLQRTIENLLSSTELMHTLRLFIDYNQSYKQTAEQLHIHINTLHYGLKKIEEQTKKAKKQSNL